MVHHHADVRLDRLQRGIIEAELGLHVRLLFLARLGQLRQPPADLGLAAARGPDHQDVLRRDLVAQFGRELLPPPTVAQGNRDGLLGIGLADNMRIERGNNGLGGKGLDHGFSHSPRACGRGRGGLACFRSLRASRGHW